MSTNRLDIMGERSAKDLLNSICNKLSIAGSERNSATILKAVYATNAELEQLRAENERLRGYLREIRQSCLKSDLSNDTIANIYGRCQAILKEPGNDK